MISEKQITGSTGITIAPYFYWIDIVKPDSQVFDAGSEGGTSSAAKSMRVVCLTVFFDQETSVTSYMHGLSHWSSVGHSDH